MDNLEEMNKFLEKFLESPKTEPERNRKYEQNNYQYETESVIKKTKQNKTTNNSTKTKVQDQMASQMNSTKHLEKS